MARSRGVITYLTQAHHSSYGRDSLATLRTSVELLTEHYNRVQRDDVWFFHAGDVGAEQQAEVLAMCRPARAEFVKLDPWHFSLPPGSESPTMPEGLRTRRERGQWARTQRHWLQAGKYSEGYRHMIRFFTMSLWPIVARAGYEFVMRMDEDSYFRSPVRYNLFEFMAKRHLAYAYRLGSWESGYVSGYAASTRLHDIVREFVVQSNLTEPVERSGWLLEACNEPKRVQNYTLAHCGNFNAPYSNFYITRVAFWLRDDVQRFLKHVNQSHAIYYERFGDNLWHAAAFQIFLPRKRVHVFHDWAYEHVTVKPVIADNKSVPCIGFGGYALGNVSGPDALGAKRRLVELRQQLARQSALAQTSHQFYMRCFRQLPCYTAVKLESATSFVDMSLTLGTVTIEEPYCGQQRTIEERPSTVGSSIVPFYCGQTQRNRLPAASTGVTAVMAERGKLQRGQLCRGHGAVAQTLGFRE